MDIISGIQKLLPMIISQGIHISNRTRSLRRLLTTERIWYVVRQGPQRPHQVLGIYNKKVASEAQTQRFGRFHCFYQNSPAWWSCLQNSDLSRGWGGGQEQPNHHRQPLSCQKLMFQRNTPVGLGKFDESPSQSIALSVPKFKFQSAGCF